MLDDPSVQPGSDVNVPKSAFLSVIVTITLKNALFGTFTSLPGWTDGSSSIEGLAFLPRDTSAFQFVPDDMYAVSSNGAIYSVRTTRVMIPHNCIYLTS